MPITNYGKTVLASAITGSYIPPLYLVIDTTTTTITTGGAIGVTSIATAARVDQAGDTQLILSLGLANQETVTFSAVTGTGPYTYTVSATTQAHSVGQLVSRPPLATDTLANVLGEIQYDSANAPGQRIQAPAGFSPGTGAWTSSFYITYNQALVYIAAWGMSDSPLVGQGNLHALSSLGFDHTSGTRDLEIDGTLTIT